MMLPVLSSESLDTITCKTLLSSEYIDIDIEMSRTNITFTAVDHILGRHQGFACDTTQMTLKTAQVA